MRESPPAWKEKFGLDLFSLKSTASVGTISRFPLSPAVLIGEFSDSEITRKLLNLGYEQKTYKGKAYYAIRNDFGASLRDSALELSSANRVFVDKEVVAVSPETASIEEFLDVTVGETRPLRDKPLALAAFESLGETFVAALLTRTGVFNPVGQTPLTYEKPPDWGNLGPWNILAGGSGVRDGHPFFAFSIVFDDPNAADSNVDEVKARVEHYQTIVAQRFPENSVLIEKWPKRPLDEACSTISINALSWTYGSAITLHCQTQTSLLWIQLMDVRDLGVPCALTTARQRGGFTSNSAIFPNPWRSDLRIGIHPGSTRTNYSLMVALRGTAQIGQKGPGSGSRRCTRPRRATSGISV